MAYHGDGAVFGRRHDVTVDWKCCLRCFQQICSLSAPIVDRSVTMEIIHLGSGSSGNSVAYRSEDAIIVIDCGLSMKQMEKRLLLANIDPKDVDHILVTHHHMDHSKSAMKASKSWGARLHSNLETALRMGWEPVSDVRTFADLDRETYPVVTAVGARWGMPCLQACPAGKPWHQFVRSGCHTGHGVLS